MNEEEEKKAFCRADRRGQHQREICGRAFLTRSRITDMLPTAGSTGTGPRGTAGRRITLLENSINPIQQFNYTTGKNATDMAMVIDAMDILYSGKVDGFCLVTSDSDFTKLAMRLREEQMYVIGMGESKTPLALTKACNKFIRLDLISGEPEKRARTARRPPAADAGIRRGAQEEKTDSTVTPISEIEEAIITFVQNNENKGNPPTWARWEAALAISSSNLTPETTATPSL